MKVLAYLNLHHAPRLGPLTTRRSTAVVSFLGRYAIMDFMLSNFSNSGFDRIATLVDNHPDSVLKHFGSRNTFNINTKLGLEIIAYNEGGRSEEHTSELQSRPHLVCRLLLEKKK